MTCTVLTMAMADSKWTIQIHWAIFISNFPQDTASIFFIAVVTGFTLTLLIFTAAVWNGFVAANIWVTRTAYFSFDTRGVIFIAIVTDVTSADWTPTGTAIDNCWTIFIQCTQISKHPGLTWATIEILAISDIALTWSVWAEAVVYCSDAVYIPCTCTVTNGIFHTWSSIALCMVTIETSTDTRRAETVVNCRTTIFFSLTSVWANSSWKICSIN